MHNDEHGLPTVPLQHQLTTHQSTNTHLACGHEGGIKWTKSDAVTKNRRCDTLTFGKQPCAATMPMPTLTLDAHPGPVNLSDAFAKEMSTWIVAAPS